jgi:O-glycosyl hydrolase
MSMVKTRREFLRSSAVGLAATATARALPTFAMDSPGQSGEIMAWVTGEKNRFTRLSPNRWRTAAAHSSQPTIVLDPQKEFQTILGFGAAFTEAACYTFNRLLPSVRDHLFHELFHPAELGLNVCRTCMGSSDYSTKAYSYDEGEADPELQAVLD